MKQTCSVKLFLSAVFLLLSFRKAFSFNYRMCEGYAGQNERYHSGFYCPRLSDPPEQIYCCRQGNNSLKYCCNQMEFEIIMKMNLSDILATSVHRSPLPFLGIVLYGLLVLILMIADFLYYYRVNQQTFNKMISNRLLGKQLVRSILRQNPDALYHQGSKNWHGDHDSSCKDPRQAAAQTVPDIKCEA
ncbi:protein shisa-like-1a [Microcaecilia unicolor]|uniref:Protein shisa-like-1a n=1 Tax=Microcaecilia unicolor TaxID=1415580 RepID=A0A6P7X4M2_9AMPH|nr:protein shisa-like-1a [Microcaecilia unicolor]XP_030045520.1 protein shisa-like-1a [Microcaecilia unicolor]XP_030045521.1 protein shisa-like-1a [Microcaecilia unicolor]